MGKLILIALVLVWPSDVLSVQVTVPETVRQMTMFASITLRCDYSTSAPQQNVVVTWRYKSFCLDPVLDYFTTAYQAALALGQNPTNDCPDSQRTIRIVAQKQGANEAVLGVDYQQRKITIQNKADLVISEVMWWDNGMYYCSVVAPGDPTGGQDGEIQLIVYNWQVVLLIILGAILLFVLIGICCCQCCPQNCCCYVRCPCCPKTCCCPEKAVMQHRMIKDAQKAMIPWLHGQPVYAPISNGSSIHMNPLLYSDPSKQGIPLGPMPLPLPPSGHPSMLPTAHSNSSLHGTNPALDYLESQVRAMDMTNPLFPQPLPPHHMTLQQMPPQLQQMPLPTQHMPQGVPFSAGPPSMLSSLNEMSVQGVERRVIQLPPIVERPSSRHSGSRSLRPASRTSVATGRSGHYRSNLPPPLREPSPTRQMALRTYIVDSDREDCSRSSRGRQPRSRSRDDLLEEVRRVPLRRDRSYSPPRRKDSWSSEDDRSSRKGGARGRRGAWPEKPPSYTSIDMIPGRKLNIGSRTNEHFSEKSSRSGRSVVI